MKTVIVGEARGVADLTGPSPAVLLTRLALGSSTQVGLSTVRLNSTHGYGPVDTLNNGPGRLVVVVPVTSAAYGLRSHVEVEPGRSGLRHTSYARCDQQRVISTDRLSSRRGMVAPDQLRAIDQTLRFVLDL